MVGDELLLGQTTDTNAAFLGQQLAGSGFEVVRRWTVGDRHEEIRWALQQAEQSAPVIIVTGGLGPTPDDRTKDALAAHVGRRLIFRPDVMQQVEDHFRRLGRPMPAVNRNQALVPEGCQILPNAQGTAVGIWIEHDNRIYVALPGVPFELKPLVSHALIPMLKGLATHGVVLHRTVHTQGLGESLISERIADIEQSLPAHMTLAYLPHYATVRLRLTAKGDRPEILRQQLDEVVQRLVARLGTGVFGFDDTSLPKEVGEALRSRGASLAAAESCTGGMVSEYITSVGGASDYFLGGIVAYQNHVKETLLGVPHDILMTQGPVCEAVVQHMVVGITRVMQSTYGMAISGIAGPEGGTKDLPVGTVWVSVGSAEQQRSRRFLFRGDRTTIMHYAALSALGMLWRHVHGLEEPA